MKLVHSDTQSTVTKTWSPWEQCQIQPKQAKTQKHSQKKGLDKKEMEKIPILAINNPRVNVETFRTTIIKGYNKCYVHCDRSTKNKSV